MLNNTVVDRIRQRIEEAGARWNANDNVSDFIEDGEIDELIEEMEGRFNHVLDGLLIDRVNDPNSFETGRRLAKMYINELMRGRYHPAPNVTAFPNDDVNERYGGILVNRAEILSMCSHHHQPVKGVCYIGLIPSVKVIGLSKYTRIAQWCARRGTLQEDLTRVIASEIRKHTGTEDLAVYIQAEHGCMTNRGVQAHSSLTQTTVLHGQFFKDDIKEEFLKYVQMQQIHARH